METSKLNGFVSLSMVSIHKLSNLFIKARLENRRRNKCIQSWLLKTYFEPIGRESAESQHQIKK